MWKLHNRWLTSEEIAGKWRFKGSRKSGIMFPQSTKISLSTWQVVPWPWFSYAYGFTTLFHKFITILLGLWILAKVTTHYARDRVIRVNNCRWEGCIEQKIRKITCETLDRDFEIEWVIAEKGWYIYEYPSNPNSLSCGKRSLFL